MAIYVDIYRLHGGHVLAKITKYVGSPNWGKVVGIKTNAFSTFVELKRIYVKVFGECSHTAIDDGRDEL